MEADQNNDATVDFNTIIVIMLQGIHQMFSPIWFTNFSHKYFLIFYWSKQGFFLSLPVLKEIMTIIRYKNQQIRNSRLVKPSDEFVICQFTYLICLSFCGIDLDPITSTTIISYFEPCYYRGHDMLSRIFQIRIYDFFHQYFSVEKENKFLIGLKRHFFSLLSI